MGTSQRAATPRNQSWAIIRKQPLPFPVPLHIVTAQKDTVLTPKYHGNWLRARLPQAVCEEVANAGHFAFMAPPLIQLNSDAGDPGEDPPGFDRANYLLRLEQQVVRFFDSVLLKIEKARVSDR